MKRLRKGKFSLSLILSLSLSFSLWLTAKLGHQSSPALGLRLTPQHSWLSGLQAQAGNHVSQFLIRNIFNIFCYFSLEKPD